MTIISDQANANPQNLLHMAGELSTQNLPERFAKRIIDFNYCLFECCYTELAFGKAGNVDIENDKKEFLFDLLLDSDTAFFKLFKGGVEVADLNDNTYGEYFGLGSLPGQPLYTGFIIDWFKVLDAFGSGQYTFQNLFTSLGVPETFESHNFSLMQFSDNAADGTVRIETVQNGNIVNNRLDYTGLNWPQSIRIKGRLWNKTPERLNRNYPDQDRELQQVQDANRNAYTIETKLLKIDIADKLIYDNLLSNKVLATDYNIINEDVTTDGQKLYTKLPLYPTEYGQPKGFYNETKKLYQFVFTDKKQDNVKTNYFL